MKCKNCGKEIYKAKSHDCWYHKEDDCTLCDAPEKINFNHIFNEAKPEDSPLKTNKSELRTKR